jgi:hypothetical protein
VTETAAANVAATDDTEPIEELTFGPTEDVADGTYPATLADLSGKTVDTDDGPRDLIIWGFDVEGPDGRVRIEGVSSRLLTARAKATAWTAALLGADAVRSGNRVRTAELVGKACLVAIEHTDAGYPRVATVLPPVGRKAA